MDNGMISGGLEIISPPPESTQTPTPAPSPTPTPEPTETPTPEPTPEPTDEPTETPTPDAEENDNENDTEQTDQKSDQTDQTDNGQTDNGGTVQDSPVVVPVTETIDYTEQFDMLQESIELLTEQNAELQTRMLEAERTNGVLLAVLLAAVIMEIFWKRILK